MPGRERNSNASDVDFGAALTSFAEIPNSANSDLLERARALRIAETFSIEDETATRRESAASGARPWTTTPSGSAPKMRFKSAMRHAYESQQHSYIQDGASASGVSLQEDTTILVAEGGGVRNIKDKTSIYRLSVERRRGYYKFRLGLAFGMIGLNFYAIGYTNVGILRQQSGLSSMGSKGSPQEYNFTEMTASPDYDPTKCATVDSSLYTQCGIALDAGISRERGHTGRCCIFYSLLPIGVALYEFVGFIIVFIAFLRSAFKVLGPSHFDRWYHFSMVAWSWLRMLSRFSAVMFLGHVHPSIILDAMHKATEKRKREQVEWKRHSMRERIMNCANIAGTQAGFIITRLMLLGVGIICVTIKVEGVHYVLQTTMETPSHGKGSEKWAGRLFSTGLVMVAFLNQMMNMLDISHRLRLRALAFVFAGEDAIYQHMEMVEVGIYQARVAEGIWDEFAEQDGKYFALAVLFCFNHQDVQRLAVKETKSFSHPELAMREMSSFEPGSQFDGEYFF